MTREELLRSLKTVEFKLIDPSSTWDDVGFTEREIWVNSSGYGYIADDESVFCWAGKNLPQARWTEIQKKIQSKTLEWCDVEGTCLGDLLTELFDEPCEGEEYDVNEILGNLLSLPTVSPKMLYCMDTADGLEFFSDEKEFKKSYERDWCDVRWEDLEDKILAEWRNRLINIE